MSELDADDTLVRLSALRLTARQAVSPP